MFEIRKSSPVSLNHPLLTPIKPKTGSSALAFVHHVQLFFSFMPTHKTERPQEISHNTQHASPTYRLTHNKDWCKTAIRQRTDTPKEKIRIELP